MIKVFRPRSYGDFRCLAGACPDTCCQSWDIDVDPRTYALYQALPGELGEKIRTHLHPGEDGPVITLEDGHCPLHRSDGLCALQASFGEEALCDTCRDFPRLTHDYGDFREYGLELSCPEAARILLTQDGDPVNLEILPGDGEPDYDGQAMELLLTTREQALSLLSDRRLPMARRLMGLFFFGLSVQKQLDGEPASEFSLGEALEQAQAMAQPGSFREIPEFFSGLEILTPAWQELLQQAQAPACTPYTENLAKYLVGRYWLQAVSDYDLYCRVKFILISCLLTGALPGDFIWNAHLWSKEIENDWENMDALLDAAYESPIFTDARLLGYLMLA